MLADLLKDQPVEETGLQNIIVVDNAPKVGADRMAKLQSILNKVFGRFGKIVTQDYPVDEEGVFKGWVASFLQAGILDMGILRREA